MFDFFKKLFEPKMILPEVIKLPSVKPGECVIWILDGYPPENAKEFAEIITEARMKGHDVIVTKDIGVKIVREEVQNDKKT